MILKVAKPTASSEERRLPYADHSSTVEMQLPGLLQNIGRALPRIFSRIAFAKILGASGW